MQKGTAALFLLIAGLFIVGLISIFSFRLFSSSAPQLPLNVLIPAPKQLTYKNQQLGLEFQYPNEDSAVKEDSEE